MAYAGARKVIENNGGLPRRKQAVGEVRADEPGPAGNHNGVGGVAAEVYVHGSWVHTVRPRLASSACARGRLSVAARPSSQRARSGRPVLRSIFGS